MTIRSLSNLLVVVFSLTLSACATIPTSPPIAPTVKLKSVEPVKIGFSQQDLAFLLDVNNPNDYDLALQSLSFIAKLEGNEVARGISSEKVTLPALGNALLEVVISTRIDRLMGRLLLLADSDKESVNYDVSGFVKLTNWPLKIPFNVEGTVTE